MAREPGSTVVMGRHGDMPPPHITRVAAVWPLGHRFQHVSVIIPLQMQLRGLVRCAMLRLLLVVQLLTMSVSITLSRQFFSIDVLDFPGMACIAGFSFRSKLLCSTLLLPGAVVILAVPPLILFLRKSSTDERFYREAVELFWFSLMIVMFGVYLSVSRVTLSTFSCLNLGTDGKNKS